MPNLHPIFLNHIILRLDRRIPLAFLRERLELTQMQLAKRAEITESEILRAEKQGDCMVSTMERYAKALGGELRLVIEIGDHAYSVSLHDKK